MTGCVTLLAGLLLLSVAFITTSGELPSTARNGAVRKWTAFVSFTVCTCAHARYDTSLAHMQLLQEALLYLRTVTSPT